MKTCLKKLWNNRQGNFAITTALIMVPMLGAVGLAVDISRLMIETTNFQQAVDSAVLAVARYDSRTTDAEATDIVDRMLKGNFPNLAVTVEISRDFPSATVTAHASMPTTFMALFGKDTMDFTRTASANVDEAKFEVAMALDTTGSMEGAKMTALKNAANTLVNDLQKQVTKPANLKFALVPFSTFVNVGPDFGPLMSGGKVTRKGADWLDLEGASPIAQSDLPRNFSRFALFSHLGHPWKGCVETRPVYNGIDYGINDTEPSASNPATLYVPAFAADELPTTQVNGVWQLYGNNYLSDSPAGITQQTWEQRRQRYGVPSMASFPTTMDGWAAAIPSWTKPTQDNSPTTLYSNYFANKGPNFMCEAQAITPLTSNYTTVHSAINSMTPMGNTNILEGIAWGWRVLSSRPPFTEGGSEKDTTINKILVLLTDGTNFIGTLNSKLYSSYGSFGFMVDERLGISKTSTSDAATLAMNKRTLSACKNAKTEGIQIFTILLEESNEETASMMRQCATDDSHYMLVPSASGLEDAFSKIRSSLTRMRLTN